MVALERVILRALLAACFVAPIQAQTNLQFTAYAPTSEGAVQFSWNSTTNEIYRIDYADEVIDINDGGPNWKLLVDYYPAHGSSTFYVDARNYDVVPSIPHPKLGKMRYYRVQVSGVNTSPTNPVVAISWPTNGVALSGQVVMSVSASSSEILRGVELYIDGEKQWRGLDGTNFVINTCEWPNGPHRLFAVAKSESAIEGFSFGNTITFGNAVSAYVNVTFDNLISRLSFSENFFEPELGQTQKVTAIFAANCDWTLAIQNAVSNTVRSVTGSGPTMEFNWDGTGTNGVTLPNGVYHYLLTALTNGLPSGGGGGGSGGGPPPSPQAMIVGGVDPQADTGFLLPPLPPGLTFDPADTQSELVTLDNSASTASTDAQLDQNPGQIDSGGETMMTPSLAGSNQATPAPARKPAVGVKTKSGTFGICYQTYPNPVVTQQPRNGRLPPLTPLFTGVDGGAPSSANITWSSMPGQKDEVDGFIRFMAMGSTNGIYKPAFIKGDEEWGQADIKKSALGGSNLFNTCNFGILYTHGCYGTQAEIDGIKYTYFALFDKKHGFAYLRLSDLDLGSGGPDGLRWMTLSGCNLLFPANVTSMENNSRWPANDNLHLLLGATTVTYVAPLVDIAYALKLNANDPETIRNAWIEAGQEGFDQTEHKDAMTDPVTFRVMGYQSCIGDTLFNYNDPDPNTQYVTEDIRVFTP